VSVLLCTLDFIIFVPFVRREKTICETSFLQGQLPHPCPHWMWHDVRPRTRALRSHGAKAIQGDPRRLGTTPHHFSKRCRGGQGVDCCTWELKITQCQQFSRCKVFMVPPGPVGHLLEESKDAPCGGLWPLRTVDTVYVGCSIPSGGKIVCHAVPNNNLP
jgi:hypothetical protein